MANTIQYFGSQDLTYLLQQIKAELTKYVLVASGYGLISDSLKTKLENIDLSLYATLASPALTGTPTAPTAAKSTDTTQIATTGFVHDVVDDYAPVTSPAFDGTPTTTTPTVGDNSTKIASTAFVKTAIDNALANLTGISFQNVNDFASLPQTGTAGVIYLIPNNGSNPNVKDEYFWNSTTSSYELFGTTQLDLTNYLQDTDVVELTKSEVDSTWISVFGALPAGYSSSNSGSESTP